MDERTTTAPLHVAIRVDATPESGVGHLVRMLALAEELTSRGHLVSLHGTCTVAWGLRQAADRGFEFAPVPVGAAAFAPGLLDAGVAVCVIDGYTIPPAVGRAVRQAGMGVLALVDAEFGLGQVADVYVDQNLGAVPPAELAPGASFLAGLDYVLLRSNVVSRIGQRPDADVRPRVMVVFGGTDAFSGAEVLVPMLLDTGLPVDVVAVAARPEIHAKLFALEPGPDQALEIHPPVDDLPGLAVTCHAAVSAAGTSVWEFLSLGIPTGLVCVTENQIIGYREATREAALGVGMLEELRSDAAARESAGRVLASLVGDAALRAELAARGQGLVDGRGRARVADAIEALARRRTALL